MLTRKQYELLVFINSHLKDTGVSPSFDEMKDALDLKSKSGIHRLITGLVERGFLHRLPHRARALEVLRLPENFDEQPPERMKKPVTDGFEPNVIHGDFGLSGANISKTDSEAIELPLYGRIAAGTPIEALHDQSTMISVPVDMLGIGDHFALEVDGNSMMEAGILDGDTVVIQRSDTADNGSIVVALVDENEVTLKRFRRKGHSIALEPSNKDYETRIFGPDRVKVQGQLIGLIRKY